MPQKEYHQFLDQGHALFSFMYQQLTEHQRQAEAQRLDEAASSRDTIAQATAYVWHYQARAWNRNHFRARSYAEAQATVMTQAALKRCVYLGGHPDFPQQPQLCAAVVQITMGGSISFQAHGKKKIVCRLPWTEIRGLQVLDVTDSPRPCPPPPRWRSLPFAPRPEAALRILTASADTAFHVRGHDPHDLEDRLEQLVDCIGQPTADTYKQTNAPIPHWPRSNQDSDEHTHHPYPVA